MIAALIIVGVSFFYSSRLVTQLSKEEKKKVELWAGAIEGRADQLVRAQNLFQELAKVEEGKIKLWAKATESFSKSSTRFGGSNLAVDIIEDNTTIPIII